MRLRPCFARSSRLAALVVLILLLTGCEVAQPKTLQNSTSTPGSSATPSNAIIINGDPDRAIANTPELMCAATVVADVAVSAVEPSYWNTPDRSRPSSTDDALSHGYAIITPVQFSYIHTHVDHRTQPTSEFYTLGGTVGQDRYSMDFPQVKVGETYLLVMLLGSDPAQHAYTEKKLVIHDAFPISTKGIVVLQPGSTEQGVVTPPLTKPLSQITQELANCK